MGRKVNSALDEGCMAFHVDERECPRPLHTFALLWERAKGDSAVMIQVMISPNILI